MELNKKKIQNKCPRQNVTLTRKGRKKGRRKGGKKKKKGRETERKGREKVSQISKEGSLLFTCKR